MRIWISGLNNRECVIISLFLMEATLIFENGYVLECYFNGDQFVAERYDFDGNYCHSKAAGAVATEEGDYCFDGVILEATTRRKAYFSLVEPEDGSSGEFDGHSEDSEESESEYASSESYASEEGSTESEGPFF